MRGERDIQVSVALASILCYNHGEIHIASMPFLHTRLQTWLALGATMAALVVSCISFGVNMDVNAQIFNGPGLGGGVSAASTIDGPVNQPLRVVIVRMLRYTLDFLALAAIIMIVVAGLYLVFSNGDEESAKKAKTIVKYVIIGLIVILLARLLVGFFTKELPQQLN